MINELVLQCQAKDKQALEELYDYYFDRLYGYVYRRIGNHEHTQDIVANSFLKIYKNLKNFKPKNKNSFHAWVYRIAMNEVNGFYRKQNKYRVLDDDFIETCSRHYENEEREQAARIDRGSRKGLMIKYLKRLKPKYYNLVYLRYFEEKKHKEIAQMYHMKENSVRVYIRRSLKKLKKMMEEDGEVEVGSKK